MIDREAFLKHRLGEQVVELPGVGLVRVRGLSRAEALRIRDLRDDQGAMEREIVGLALVEPVLSAEDVAEWHEHAPAGEVDLILSAIQNLSALAEGATKSGIHGVRE